MCDEIGLYLIIAFSLWLWLYTFQALLGDFEYCHSTLVHRKPLAWHADLAEDMERLI